MGSSTSSILAIVYMNALESITLSTIQVGIYKRYVDDILLLAKDKQHADEIFHTMNNANKHIKFEAEHPSSKNQLNLLDFSITINQENGKQNCDFYKKPAKKNLFINSKSAQPTRNKANFIQNEKRRISNRCTSTENKNKHLHDFKKTLELNDYQPQEIHNLMHEKKKKHKVIYNKPENKPFYYEIPFISDKIDNKIRSIFKKENLNVKIYHKSKTLRQILKKTSNPPCNLRECPINNNKICHKQHTVYKAICSKCNKFYIGSSIRPLHERAREHIRGPSSIAKHNETCKSSFKFQIIDRGQNITSIRYKEALHIQSEKPEINSKQEATEFIHLTF